jgi:hypothetical protein
VSAFGRDPGCVSARHTAENAASDELVVPIMLIGRSKLRSKDLTVLPFFAVRGVAKFWNGLGRQVHFTF